LNAPPANVAFCAKEAFFKCQFYATRNRELDFEDIVLKQTGSNRLGVKSAPQDLGNLLLETSIYLYRFDGQLVALALLAQSGV
jgi:4'-phosphopantetheinyl transferase EntD